MDIKQVQLLIEKYQICETSVEEENQLSQYFSQEIIPKELAGQKKYFQFLVEQKNIAIPNPNFENELFEKITETKTLFQRFRTPLNIAASILLLISLFILIPKDFMKKKSYFAQVEDTYKDPNEAYIETKRALAFVAEKLDTGTKELSNISTVDKGLQELNKLKKIDHTISQYGKMASINKLGQFSLSF